MVPYSFIVVKPKVGVSMQRMIDISPPIGAVIQMFPKGHISQGFAHYLLCDSSCDKETLAWLKGLLKQFEDQLAIPIPESVHNERPEVITAQGEVIPILDEHKALCKTCQHMKRVHVHFEAECAEINCQCGKFES